MPESGQVKICESTKRPGSHYCDANNVCSKCPEISAVANATKEQQEDCRAVGLQSAEATSNPFNARGGSRVQGARG